MKIAAGMYIVAGAKVFEIRFVLECMYVYHYFIVILYFYRKHICNYVCLQNDSKAAAVVTKIVAEQFVQFLFTTLSDPLNR